MWSDILWNGVEVVPSSHVGLEGNELVDERARHAALNDAAFDRPLPPVDFQVLASETRQTLVDSLTSYY
jgi:hypothetical protein